MSQEPEIDLLSREREHKFATLTLEQLYRFEAEQDSDHSGYAYHSGIFLVQPPEGSEEMSADDENKLKYEPLPTTSSIRLLKFEPVRERRSAAGEPYPGDLNLMMDPIRCSLIVRDLEDDPIYDALSYTWGDPCTVYLDRYWDSNRDQSASKKAWDAKPVDIFVDGQPVSVGVSLYTALQSARGVWHKQVRNGLDEMDPAKLSDAIWADAICINQEDLAEKSAQVRLMSRIYQRAQNVMAWLGAQDSMSIKAIVSLGTLSDAFDRDAVDEKAIDGNGKYAGVDDFGIAKWAGYDIKSSKTYDTLGIPVISEDTWIGIYAIMNRSWFKRAWIIQEICFARNPVFLCGLVQFPLDVLVRAFMFLRWSTWTLQLDRLVESPISCTTASERIIWFPGISDTEIADDGTCSWSRTRLYRSRQSHNSNPDWGSMISDNRIGLGVETTWGFADRLSKPVVDYKLDLQTLLRHHRSTEAGDPRDKIYAFLNLAQDNCGPLELVPDYKLPVRDVYSRAMKFLIATSGNLRSLSLRENVREPLYEYTAVGTKQLVNLPTWVPDFYAENRPGPMHHADWAVSRGLGPLQHDSLEDDDRLTVSGVQVASIVDCIEYEEHHLLELATFLEGFVSRSMFHSCEGASQKDSDSHHTTCHPEQRPIPPETQRLAIDFLWRTMCCDSYENISPAPPQCGQIFEEVLRFIVAMHSSMSVGGMFRSRFLDNEEAQSLSSTFELPMLRGPEEARKQAGRSYTGYLRLMGMLRTGSDDKIVHPPELIEIEKRLPPKDDVVWKKDDVDWNLVWDFCNRGGQTAVSKDCWAFRNEILGNTARRKLFATNNGQLGLGPSPLQAGDQVWILKGGDVPFILKQQATEGEYEMVGLAYVHGIMFGEAVGEGTREKVCSITLI